MEGLKNILSKVNGPRGLYAKVSNMPHTAETAENVMNIVKRIHPAFFRAQNSNIETSESIIGKKYRLLSNGNLEKSFK